MEYQVLQTGRLGYRSEGLNWGQAVSHFQTRRITAKVFEGRWNIRRSFPWNRMDIGATNRCFKRAEIQICRIPAVK